MGSFFDKMWLIIIGFLTVVVLTSFAGLKLWQCLLIAFAISTLASFFVMTINRPYRQTMRYGDWITYCVIHGKEYILSLISRLSPQSEVSDNKDYILIDGQVVFLWAKLSGISPDSIANMCSICINNGFDYAYVLCTESNKHFLYFAQRISNVKLEFCNLKRLYKSALNQGLLPGKSIRPSIKYIISSVFRSLLDRSNVKRYVFVSVILLAFSFITPLSTYYLVISSIALALALLCLVKDVFSHTTSHDDTPDTPNYECDEFATDISTSDNTSSNDTTGDIQR
ncbi:MAG: hypothetical protein ACI4M5_01485 [Christensenellales bacterium]